MTEMSFIVMPARVGRKRLWSEDMGARFPAGTFARMKRVLGPKESKTDLVRRAVEAELARREGLAKRSRPKKG